MCIRDRNEFADWIDQLGFPGRYFFVSGIPVAFIRFQSFYPVSYTHLDVYKRQVHDDDQVHEPLRQRHIGAVSYTHLDVYKRQYKSSGKTPELLSVIGEMGKATGCAASCRRQRAM